MRAVRSVSTPVVLSAPPATSSPGSASTGMLSPVSSERSMAEVPAMTTASTGTRWPGRTTITSPTTSEATGTTISPSAVTSAASGELSSASARTASPARRRARSSSTRPASSSAVTTAATSKVRAPVEPRAVSDRCIGMVAASVSSKAATLDR